MRTLELVLALLPGLLRHTRREASRDATLPFAALALGGSSADASSDGTAGHTGEDGVGGGDGLSGHSQDGSDNGEGSRAVLHHGEESSDGESGEAEELHFDGVF